MAQSDAQSKRGNLTRLWPVALVLVTGLGLTLIVVNVLRDTARRHDELRFETMTKGVMEMIDTRFELFAQALTGLRDLFALRDTVDDRLWLNYVEAMQPAVHFRGLHELGFAERVFTPDERLVNYLRTNSAPASPHLQPRLEEHLKRLRASAGTSYSIRPLEPDFCPYAFPVTRCWRVDGAIEAAKQRLGENLYPGTDPDEAMPWTIGTFLPAATRALDLRTGQGSRRGVRLLLTVTRPDMPSRSEHELGRQLIPGLAVLCKPGWRLQFRRQDCYSKGVVYFTVEMESFLRSTLVGRSPEIAFALYQGTNRTPEEYLHGVTLADYTARTGAPYLTRTDRLRLYGQKLTFDFYTLPSFETRSLRVWPRMGGTVGSVLTLLVAWGVWISTRARLRQEAISADLRESRDRLQAALQARDRLNRDLHDTVIQSIYAVGLGLQSARRILGKDPERTSGRMTELMADLNSIIARLRGYIHGAPEHSVSSLAGLLEETLAPFRRETTATVSLRIDSAAEGWRLDSPTIIEVASIVREAVSNSVRHAGATTINVRVGVAEERLSVMIEDDGGGFDQTTKPLSGDGLNNIRARVAEMNGTVIFESAPGRGTAVRFLLPVSNHTSDSIPE